MPENLLIELLIVTAVVIGLMVVWRAQTSRLRDAARRGRQEHDLRCPSETCGHLNDRRARFCANCGRPLRPVASDTNNKE